MKMLDCAEHELDGLLAAWLAAEDRILHLYELDPTHVVAQPARYERSTERHSAQESRSPLPFCWLSDEAPAPVLLELDPVHLYVH
jgi:hypothetical protein